MTIHRRTVGLLGSQTSEEKFKKMISSKWGRNITTTDELLQSIINPVGFETNISEIRAVNRSKFKNNSTDKGKDLIHTSRNHLPYTADFSFNESQVKDVYSFIESFIVPICTR